MAPISCRRCSTSRDMKPPLSCCYAWHSDVSWRLATKAHTLGGIRGGEGMGRGGGGDTHTRPLTKNCKQLYRKKHVETASELDVDMGDRLHDRDKTELVLWLRVHKDNMTRNMRGVGRGRGHTAFLSKATARGTGASLHASPD